MVCKHQSEAGGVIVLKLGAKRAAKDQSEAGRVVVLKLGAKRAAKDQSEANGYSSLLCANIRAKQMGIRD
jgi:hypothetical protein